MELRFFICFLFTKCVLVYCQTVYCFFFFIHSTFCLLSTSFNCLLSTQCVLVYCQLSTAFSFSYSTFAFCQLLFANFLHTVRPCLLPIVHFLPILSS
ncbi:MAG: hypothetical protein JWP12_568 [Bacteroidetes bacterium]|nr:hypothetical protein [Bacteroidota bacterium]